MGAAETFQIHRPIISSDTEDHLLGPLAFFTTQILGMLRGFGYRTFFIDRRVFVVEVPRIIGENLATPIEFQGAIRCCA